MNLFKSFLLAGAVLLLSFPAFAQGPGGLGGQSPRDRGPRGPQPEVLQELLDLSDEQMEALKPIFEETQSQMQALRDKDFESREARQEAGKAIFDAQREELAKILSEEQLEKLDALHEQRGPGANAGQRGKQGPRGKEGPNRGARFGDGNAELHEALKAYRTENVDPVLRAQRLKLETELSAEDKATIAALRAKRDAHFAALQEAKENGERPAPPTEEQRAERKADHETVQALVTKYGSDIDALLAEVKTQADKWEEDIKAIHEKYRPDDAPNKPGKGQAQGQNLGNRGPKGKGQGEMGAKLQQMRTQMHKTQFLMMDPNQTSTNSAMEESPFELEAYPNPASSMANISYSVQKAGKVTIVLRNKAGNVSRVLFDGYQDAGEHTLEVNTSGLQNGTYFYTITDASSRKPVTKQLIITQ